MSATKKYQVDIATNPSVIMITAEPVANNVTESFPIAEIVQVTPVFFDFSSPASPVTTLVVAYAAAPNEITFAGNYVADLTAGDIIAISGSSDNDGNYTVVSSVVSGANTVVTVTETIIPTTVDGSVTFTPNSGTVENTSAGDDLRATYPYKRMTKLIIETQNKKLTIELQDVTNHATWSTGTKAGLKVAALAINALL